MITYDYHCDANGETITVSHSIKETLTNWAIMLISESSYGPNAPVHSSASSYFLPGNSA